MKKLFFSLLAVAAMASCSKSELADRPVSGDKVEIKASGLNIQTSAGRAPFEGAIAEDNKLLAYVLVSTKSKDYNPAANPTVLWNGYAAAGDNQMEFVGAAQYGFQTPCFFPTSGSDVYLRGFYPSTGWKVLNDVGNNYDYTIDGKTDVMAANEVTTNKAEALAGTYQTLEFNHLLTKLVIKVQAESAAAAAAPAEGGWGKITNIYLKSAAGAQIYPVVRVDATETNPAVYRVDEDGNRLESLPCYIIDEDGVFTDDVFAGIELTYPTEPAEGQEPEEFVAPSVAYSLIHPVTATEKHYTLFVETEGEPAGRAVDVTLEQAGSEDAFTDSTAGYAFSITVTFKATDIKAKATVTPWKQGGNTNVDFE